MTTPASEHPGDEIRRARQARGWTQSELAQRTGLGVRTIRRVEAGKGDPDSRTLARLRHVLGLSTERAADRLAALSEVDRADLIEWALDEASDIQWLTALGRRFDRHHRPTPALPDRDLHLPRRNGSTQRESGTHG